MSSALPYCHGCCAGNHCPTGARSRCDLIDLRIYAGQSGHVQMNVYTCMMVLCSCPDVMRGCSEMNMAGHKPSQQFGKAGKAMAPQLAVVGPTINGYPSYLACASTANSMRADLRNTRACPPSALAIPWACWSPARGAASTPNRSKGCTLVDFHQSQLPTMLSKATICGSEKRCVTFSPASAAAANAAS